MVLADETPHEEQPVNQNFSSPMSDDKTSPKVGDSFICLKEVRSVSRAKALRLKIGDVIVGIEGNAFNGKDFHPRSVTVDILEQHRIDRP